MVNRIDLEWLEPLAQETDEDRAVWELLAPLESRGVLQAVDGAYEVAPGIRTRHLPATPQVIRPSTSRMAGHRCCCRATGSITRRSCRSPSWRPSPTTTPRPPVGCADWLRWSPRFLRSSCFWCAFPGPQHLEGGVAIMAPLYAATGESLCR